MQSITRRGLVSDVKEVLVSIAGEVLVAMVDLASFTRKDLTSVAREALASVAREALVSVAREALASVAREALASVAREGLFVGDEGRLIFLMRVLRWQAIPSPPLLSFLNTTVKVGGIGQGVDWNSWPRYGYIELKFADCAMVQANKLTA